MWKMLTALDLTLQESRPGLPNKTVQTLPRRVQNGGKRSQV